MSDPRSRTATLTGRGEAPLQPSRLSEEPPEQSVTGVVRYRGDEGQSERSTRFNPGELDQLALALAERLKPAEVERPMFGELVEGWLEYIAKRRVCPDNERRLARRLLPLFLEDEKSLTAAMVAELIEQQTDLSASTRNKLRGVGRMVIDYAQAAQRWERPNPFSLTKREKEPRRKYEQLSLEELYRVQLHLRADRLRLFRAALHLGMRPGELMALRIDDVDFPNNVVHVRRSRERETTKTGTTRDIPLHPAVLADLLDACVEAKGELVFGHRLDGSLESQNTKLTRILRTAMIKADVGILGADYVCRRKGCGHRETHLGPIDRRRRKYCPKCDFKLLPVAIARDVRWYDLRHMCATFHHDAGADGLCVKIALGHSLEGITEEVYTHPTMAKLGVELSKWKLPRPPRQD